MAIFFIILQALALSFFVETLRRVKQRVNEFPMKDAPEHLPFGFIRLRHLVALYLVLYIGWLVLSFWLYFDLMPPLNPTLPQPAVKPFEY